MIFNNKKIPKHLIIHDGHYAKQSYGMFWLFLALLILISSMVISMQSRAETSGQSLPKDSGQILVQETTGPRVGQYLPITHLRSYRSKQPTEGSQSQLITEEFIGVKESHYGVYIFPVPEWARVTALYVNRGGETGHHAHNIADKKLVLRKDSSPQNFSYELDSILPHQKIVMTIELSHHSTSENKHSTETNGGLIYF